MTTFIQQLASWSSTLQPSMLPPSVRQRARLQHLHSAAVINPLLNQPLGQALQGQGLRQHAALLACLGQDAEALGGRVTLGAVPAAWASCGAHSLEELVSATVAGNEVGARIGLAMWLDREPGSTNTAPISAAAAVCAAKLHGATVQQMGHALALAVSGSHNLPVRVHAAGGDGAALLLSQAVLWGVEAVALAMAGAAGDLSVLDAQPHGCPPHLLRAYTGLGEAWLTETLSFSFIPGPMAFQVPIQSIWEILRRHIKAADKRLRVDQIERIEIRMGAFGAALSRIPSNQTPAGVVRSIHDLIGVLVVAHDLAPQRFSPQWLEDNQAQIQTVAQRVSVIHDGARSIRDGAAFVQTMGPLLGECSPRTLQSVIRGPSREWASAEIDRQVGMAVLRARPDKLWAGLRRAGGSLTAARLDEFQFHFDTEVKLFTTRGGCWPERRSLPEGSPGWDWQKTIAGILSQLPEGVGQQMLNADKSETAGEWVAGLWSEHPA